MQDNFPICLSELTYDYLKPIRNIIENKAHEISTV